MSGRFLISLCLYWHNLLNSSNSSDRKGETFAARAGSKETSNKRLGTMIATSDSDLMSFRRSLKSWYSGILCSHLKYVEIKTVKCNSVFLTVVVSWQGIQAVLWQAALLPSQSPWVPLLVCHTRTYHAALGCSLAASSRSWSQCWRSNHRDQRPKN